jgi:hypothetical protein
MYCLRFYIYVHIPPDNLVNTVNIELEKNKQPDDLLRLLWDKKYFISNTIRL